MRAITYARVSSDDRSKGGRNLAGQLDMGREYCEKKGYTIIAELAEDDRGASGAAFELEQLNRIREMAHKQEFDVLVVREIDRLSRNLAKQLIVEEELKRSGVRIEYVLYEYPDSPEGNLMKNMRATVAEYERLKIAERNTRGRRQKVKAGSVMTHGQSPYGYLQNEENGKWVLCINEKEAKIVRLIFDVYTSHDESIGIIGVVRKLSKMRIPTYLDTRQAESEAKGENKKYGRKTRKWGEWSRASVHRILRNETYAGIWRYGKRGIDADGNRVKNDADHLLDVEVPPIVSREIWEAAQAKLSSNRDNAKRNLKHEYLLRRRVYCGDCGCKMQATPNYSGKKVYFYYVCKANRTFARDCNNTVSYSAQKLDPQSWHWVKSLLSDPEQLLAGFDEYQSKQDKINAPLRERITVIDDLLQENNKQLDRLLDLYLDGDFPKDVLTERKTRLEGTIKSLEQERRGIVNRLDAGKLSSEKRDQIAEFAERVYTGLENADESFDTRRRIIELVDLKATLIRENGEKVAYVTCILGEDNWQVASTSIGMAGKSRYHLWPMLGFT